MPCPSHCFADVRYFFLANSFKGFIGNWYFPGLQNHPLVLSLEGGGKIVKSICRMGNDDARARRIAGLKQGGGVGRVVLDICMDRKLGNPSARH